MSSSLLLPYKFESHSLLIAIIFFFFFPANNDGGQGQNQLDLVTLPELPMLRGIKATAKKKFVYRKREIPTSQQQWEQGIGYKIIGK